MHSPDWVRSMYRSGLGSIREMMMMMTLGSKCFTALPCHQTFGLGWATQAAKKREQPQKGSHLQSLGSGHQDFRQKTGHGVLGFRL